MIKQLEAHITQLQKVLDGPHGKYWAHGPAFESLIAALERSQQYAKQRDEENQDLMLTVGRLRVEREQLGASHNALREAMAGIHNTISRDGAYTPLAAIMSAAKRAHEESANIVPVASPLAVKLPAELIDEVCLAAAEIHNRGNGVDDDKAQFIIDCIRNYLENGGLVEGE